MRLPLLLALIAAAPAAAQEPASAPPSAAEWAEATKASERGRMIAGYDRIAWLATDDLLARLSGKTDRVGGWVVEGAADAPLITFVERGAGRALYRARLDARGRLTDARLLGGGDPRELTPAQQRLVSAKDRASAAFFASKPGMCAPTFNTVVLPPETPGEPTLVYFLAAQTEAEKLPFGGHYRVPVAADGTAGPVHAFSKSCIALPMHPREPKGEKAEMAVISHLTGTVPTEVHVFSAGRLGVPLAVVIPATPGRVWIVTPSEMRPAKLPA